MSTQKAEVVEISNPVPEAEIVKGSPSVTGVADDGKFDSVSSMADLKEKAPDVYDAMLQGIGMNICREMQDHQKRLHKILKKARDNN